MYTLISVVIPTFQRSALLGRCLQALSRQTLHKNWFEVMVVSDGPDTTTAALVNRFKQSTDLPIEYRALPHKAGPAAARNTGWINACGKYIAFTDDDCVPDPLWLETLLKAFENGKGQAFYGKVKVPVTNPPTDYEWNTRQLEKPQFITANAACTKAALWTTGGFDERFRIAWREDSDLEFALRKEGISPRFLPEALVVHPVRPAQWGISIAEQKKALYNALLYKKHPLYYKKYIRQFVPPAYYTMAFAAVLAGLFFLLRINGIAFVFLLVWATGFTAFVLKRLRHTKHAAGHVLEMICTSACIPFSSIYWNWLGRCKFRNNCLQQG
ncbi:hypothetical protein A8C56_13690 [Niabella ginsenosidivorans]|uniref:Glycosyltransferase 2-like domain-containing protein n=1 Tax=Niabella ginsenosidivorans TaxID=1176587 RepID=A0A1A9I3I5_9BACT|nr:glycosyltransferase [Niabella ginsenosidivorans]ANH81885.1 hypothetical protein A8C56_13690 [Niabella ginsenosidivorans]